MGSASIITISSSSSSKSSVTLRSILTLSSEYLRVPVSWTSSPEQASLTTDFNKPLNHSDKVKEWICACTFEKVEEDELSEFAELDDQIPSTCIRYDFDKTSPTVEDQSQFDLQNTATFPSPQKREPTVEDDRIENQDFNQDRKSVPNGHKTDTREITLSPLSSEKTEFCNYLKLMKPEEHKKKFLIKHRRSGRLKTHLNGSKEKTEPNSDKLDSKNINNGKSSHKKHNLKRKSVCSENEVTIPLLPLPPSHCYNQVTDFEDSIKFLVKESKKKVISRGLTNLEKRRKYQFGYKLKPRVCQFSYKRVNSLRSTKSLRSISLDKLIRNGAMRKRARTKIFKQKQLKKNVENKVQSPDVTVNSIANEKDVDLKNFVDDMLELDKMSVEHRKSVIESRIVASNSITNLINKITTQEADLQKAFRIFLQLLNERKPEDEQNDENHKSNQSDKTENELLHKKVDLVINSLTDHDYSNPRLQDLEENSLSEETSDTCSLSSAPLPDVDVLPVNKIVQIKSLHRCLTLKNPRKFFLNNYTKPNGTAVSNNGTVNHSVSISKKHGMVLQAFYDQFNLIVIQESLVSFWTQSALGNVLGAQNMWIPKGQISRLALKGTYVQKHATDLVIATETSISYVELWTKEHKSDLREVPVADVFAVVYFWRARHQDLEKKALQLENIKGFAEHVQYCILKSWPKIIVSWHLIQGNERKTKIRSYHLAADFQTIASVSEIEPVEHYVSSLHNVEGCDDLVMGCGSNQVTLWNVQYGYIVATIEMTTVETPLSTLWVKCDRGFLFTIQECDQELRLIAINGINHSWKKLQTYHPLPGFDKLKGVCMQNGILAAYYSQGILCWNAQSGELIVEEIPTDSEYIPSGQYVIIIINEKIIIRHSLSHLITDL